MIVRRFTTICCALLIGMVLTIPGAAQTGPTLEASVGLQGFVPRGEPTEITARISAPVLLAGRLRARGGGVAVSRPVEVPAAGDQVYTLTMPPLPPDTRVTVEVLDGDDAVLISEVVNVRSRSAELTVGVIGGDGLLGTLGRVRASITGIPVAAFSLPAAPAAGSLDVLDYVVVETLEDDVVSWVSAWVDDGGRLVIDSAIAPVLDLTETPLPLGVSGASVVASGSGSVIVVDGLTGRTAEELGDILRPVPIDLGALNPGFDQGFEMQSGLMAVAAESGRNQVPALPWLFFAILGFALVIGPINFTILSRLDKRDWAWVTIPVVSIVALVGFWVAGRQRISGTELNHSSVVEASASGTTSRTALIVSAGVQGQRELSFDEGVEMYPERSNTLADTVELRLSATNRAVLDLDQLGFTGIGLANLGSNMTVPSMSVSTDGDSVAIENSTPYDFWGWGIVNSGGQRVGEGMLASGGATTVSLPNARNQFGFGLLDAIVQENQLWDEPDGRSSITFLQAELGTATTEPGVYFVGFTSDFAPSIGLDGRTVSVDGITMIVVQVDDVDGDVVEVARADQGEVVGTGFVNWLDLGSAILTLSADELTLRYGLPPGVTSAAVRLRGQIGPGTTLEGWNYEANAFESLPDTDVVDSRFIAGDGSVFLRVSSDQDFGEVVYSPGTVDLEWSA